MSERLPRVVADTPLDATIEGLLRGRVELLPWDTAGSGVGGPVEAIYTYGHPAVDAAMMDRLPGLKVISNYGVGVDHIRLADAAARGIAVGNTPGVLEATTADLGLALLLASARRIVEGDRYARSPEFVRYDPGYMLGREVHDRTLGIIGMGQIGRRVARRAIGFDMAVLYHNRRRRPDVEEALAPSVRFAGLDELLAQSDYVMLCVPLTDRTRGLIGERALGRMKPTATLINIARGAVVDTDALARALADGRIAAAALDVTEPEPLPRDHPLLALPQVIITPHLGSATVETRRRMAELSVENLLAGLRGEPLPHPVGHAVPRSVGPPEAAARAPEAGRSADQ
jgi:glyoxylate reductase